MRTLILCLTLASCGSGSVTLGDVTSASTTGPIESTGSGHGSKRSPAVINPNRDTTRYCTSDHTERCLPDEYCQLCWNFDQATDPPGCVARRCLGYCAKDPPDCIPLHQSCRQDGSAGPCCQKVQFPATHVPCTGLDPDATCEESRSIVYWLKPPPDNICFPPPCANGHPDGDETDSDCGGRTCGTCGIGQRCRVPTDCNSGICTNGTCVACSNDAPCLASFGPRAYCSAIGRCGLHW